MDLQTINAEVELMKGQDSPKWVVLARKHLPDLRKAFWSGESDPYETQRLIRELSLQQTLPLNEIGREWVKVGENWYEADSYTHEWVEENDVAEGKRAPAVYVDPLPSRIIEAMAELGYDETQAAQAVAASSFNISLDEEVWYEAGEIPSVPIKQEAEDMKIEASEAYEMSHFIQPQRDEIFRFRTEFFEYARDLRMYAEGLWQFLWRSAINASYARHDFLYALQKATELFEPQYVARAFLSMQDEEWGLSMSDAKLIEVNNTNLYTFIETFWHMVEDDLDPAPGRYATSEDEAYEIASQYEREIIETYPEEDKNIQNTRAYFEGMLKAIGTESNLKSAGYDAWRYSKSPKGALAFKRVFEGSDLPLGKRSKLAWAAFWQAVRIVEVRKNGLMVENQAKGKKFFVGYQRATEMLENHRIPLTYSEAVKLKKILTEQGWGEGLRGVL